MGCCLCKKSDHGTPLLEKDITRRLDGSSREIDFGSTLPVHRSYSGNFGEFYTLGEHIGDGCAGQCYLCKSKATGEQFAVKIVDKKQFRHCPDPRKAFRQLRQEIRALQLLLPHENIVRFENAFEDKGKIYIITELLSGGELFDYVIEKGTLSEEEAANFVRQILQAISFMHSKNILHRDIKPENIILNDRSSSPSVKLIDFGSCRVLPPSHHTASSPCGSVGYLAPEIVGGKEYGKVADVWSVGVIAFVLLCGCMPFDQQEEDMYNPVNVDDFCVEFPPSAESLGRDAKDFVQQMLQFDSRYRFSADIALQHPWLAASGRAGAPMLLQSPMLLRSLRVQRKRFVLGSAPLMPAPGESGRRRGPAPRLAGGAPAAG